MAGRQSRGRQRIPMRLIEGQDDLYATFSKRRRGLYNKASELSTLCGADVGIIIFSPTNNPFSFWHPSFESVIGRYRNPNQPLDDHTRFIEANARERIEYLNRQLDEVLDEKEGTKEQDRELDEIDKTREKGWWEHVSVENLNKDQVEEWKARFEDLISKVKRRAEELRNGASSSTATQQQMIGPSYPPPMGMMVGPSQFHGQYYNVPPQAHLPFTSHVPVQYYPSSEPHYPSAGDVGPDGNIFTQFQGPFNYFPLQAQDPSTGGTGAGAGALQAQDPSTSAIGAQDPSTSGIGDGAGGPSTSRGAAEPSTSRGDREPSTRAGTGEAGPSRRGDTNP